MAGMAGGCWGTLDAAGKLLICNHCFSSGQVRLGNAFAHNSCHISSCCTMERSPLQTWQHRARSVRCRLSNICSSTLVCSDSKVVGAAAVPSGSLALASAGMGTSILALRRLWAPSLPCTVDTATAGTCHYLSQPKKSECAQVRKAWMQHRSMPLREHQLLAACSMHSIVSVC